MIRRSTAGCGSSRGAIPERVQHSQADGIGFPCLYPLDVFPSDCKASTVPLHRGTIEPADLVGRTVAFDLVARSRPSDGCGGRCWRGFAQEVDVIDIAIKWVGGCRAAARAQGIHVNLERHQLALVDPGAKCGPIGIL